MNENMTELTEQDVEDLKLLQEEPTTIKFTLLKTWRELLSNIEVAAAEKVGPGLASRIVSSWPKLAIQDVPLYHDLYHSYLLEARDVLDIEIGADPDALNVPAKDDAVENRAHYLNLLFEWQVLAMRWENAWDASDETAHIQLAALADAQSFITGQQGLVEHLTQIGFKFDEDDRDALGAALLEAKEAL